MTDFEVFELLVATLLTTGFEQSTQDALDFGRFLQVDLEFDVLVAGTGSGGEALVLQHCATQHGRYLDVTGGGIPIDGTAASAHKHVTSLLRYVRLKVVGTVAGAPVVAVRAICRG